MSGIVQPNVKLEEKLELFNNTCISRFNSEGYLYLSALNLHNNQIAVHRNSDNACFKFLAPQQSETLTPIHAQLLTLANFKKLDNFPNEINHLEKNEDFNADSQSSRTKPDCKEFWFPTLDTCQNSATLNGVERRYTMSYKNYKNRTV